jgi:hypothetical protein
MKNIELLQKAIEHTSQEGRELIVQFINSNTVQSNKFNPYNYIEKKGFRETLKGVYFEAGTGTVTDAHILINYKTEYPAEYEKKIIDKAGQEIVGTFPTWQNIVPKEPGERHEINPDKYIEIAKRAKAENKALQDEQRRAIQIGNTFFDPELFSKFCIALKRFKVTSIELYGASSGAKAANEEFTGIIMPIPSEHAESYKVLDRAD